MPAVLAVFLGGGLGALCRFYLTKILANYQFPGGTVAANLIGCLLIGLLFNVSFRLVPAGPWKLFLATGFLGGLTTFSTFSLEFIQLMQAGKIQAAALYLTLNLIIGITLTYSFLNAGSSS
jgi:CrcB protein